MNFDNSFSLEEMKAAAQTKMSKTRERVDAVQDMVDERLGGRSRLSLLGAVLVSLVWAGAFLIAYHFFKHYIPELFGFPLAPLLLGVSLALVAFVLFGYLVQMKYYGTILSAQRRLSHLRDRVAKGQKNLSKNLQVYMGRRGDQWELPLKAGTSIDQEASQIASQLTGMEALSTGFIIKSKLILYYAACIVWALVGGYTIVELAGGMDDTKDILIVLALMVVACIIEVAIAEVAWSTTNDDVGNATLLAILAGPVIFGILFIVAALVIALAQAVISNLAIIIGIACVLSSASGG